MAEASLVNHERFPGRDVLKSALLNGQTWFARSGTRVAELGSPAGLKNIKTKTKNTCRDWSSELCCSRKKSCRTDGQNISSFGHGRCARTRLRLEIEQISLDQRQTIGILSNVHYQHPLWFSALPMNHLFCSWGFGWVDKAQSSDRLAFGAIGSSPDFKSRVFHDIWLLGICRETLFSSASNNPNSSKSFNPTAPPHAVPMYFKCSVHQCALKTVSGNSPAGPEVNRDRAGPRFRVQQTAPWPIHWMQRSCTEPDGVWSPYLGRLGTVSMTVGDSLVRRAKTSTVTPIFFFLSSKRNVSGRFWRILQKILGTVFCCNGLV